MTPHLQPLANHAPSTLPAPIVSPLHLGGGSQRKDQEVDLSKTFLLGVGCQRGGTTWLHRYLSSSPQVNFGFRKEYHLFDALHVQGFKWFKQNVEEAYAEVLAGVDLHENRPYLDRLAGFYRDTENYYDYFNDLHASYDAVRVVGDLTPSYSGVPISVLAEIRSNLEQRGFRPKVIFIMRDPVDRMWSAARLEAKRIGDLSEEAVANWIDTCMVGPRTKKRSRYQVTLKRIYEVFPAEDVKVLLYEDLFTRAAVRGITDFLGIDPIKATLKEKFNKVARTSELPEDLQYRIARNYKWSYGAAARMFGVAHIEELWPSSRFVNLTRLEKKLPWSSIPAVNQASSTVVANSELHRPGSA